MGIFLPFWKKAVPDHKKTYDLIRKTKNQKLLKKIITRHVNNKFGIEYAVVAIAKLENQLEKKDFLMLIKTSYADKKQFYDFKHATHRLQKDEEDLGINDIAILHELMMYAPDEDVRKWADDQLLKLQKADIKTLSKQEQDYFYYDLVVNPRRGFSRSSAALNINDSELRKRAIWITLTTNFFDEPGWEKCFAEIDKEDEYIFTEGAIWFLRKDKGRKGSSDHPLTNDSDVSEVASLLTRFTPEQIHNLLIPMSGGFGWDKTFYDRVRDRILKRLQDKSPDLYKAYMEAYP